MTTLTYSDLVTLLMYGTCGDCDREIARLSEDYSIAPLPYAIVR